MIGISIIAAVIAAGIITADAARVWLAAERLNVQHDGKAKPSTPLAALVAASSKRAGKPASARQVLFQVRALTHGMPADGTHAAHECTRSELCGMLVAAACTDGSGHTLFADGKPVTATVNGKGSVTITPAKVGAYANKVGVLNAYYAARNADYVRHSAACTDAHIAARQQHMTARVGGITGRVINNPAPAAKRAAMADSGK